MINLVVVTPETGVSTLETSVTTPDFGEAIPQCRIALLFATMSIVDIAHIDVLAREKSGDPCSMIAFFAREN
jgi:hypothetical protein